LGVGFANNFNYDFHIALDPTKTSTEFNRGSLDVRDRPPGPSVFARVRGQAPQYGAGDDGRARCCEGAAG
jgi:hypothetical protein